MVEVGFAHPVSLESAVAITEVSGIPIEGYRIESDSIAGEFWVDGGLTVEQFLSEISTRSGTAPEIVGAYIDAAALEERPTKLRSSLPLLGAEFPQFDAPPANPRLAEFAPPSASSSGPASAAVGMATAGDEWAPNDAQVFIEELSSTNLIIDARYWWYGIDPFAAPTVMSDKWGMEFQVDFYAQARSWGGAEPFPGRGLRPYCPHNPGYKDYALASTREFTWFAWVLNRVDLVVPPANLGLYGDYNDLSDPCFVSTIAVGMAQPQMMPFGDDGSNHLSLFMYPLKGEEATSRVGAIVQPVERQTCEDNPTWPLTNCMGVGPGSYPGPGMKRSRMVLNSDDNHLAPNLCWYSPNFGNDSAGVWACDVW